MLGGKFPRGFKAGKEHTAVDEIKFMAPAPLIFCVVDFELAVWWHVFGLDCTEICSYDRCGGVSLCIFQCPKSRAGTYV